MWDWSHFKHEGWLKHSRRAWKLSALLTVGAVGMILHALIPFWQQPRWMSASAIRDTLDYELRQRARDELGLK